MVQTRTCGTGTWAVLKRAGARKAHELVERMSSKQVIIIGGAEKAGTTSLYTYLAAHPGITPSLRKETDHFRSSDASLESYLLEFPQTVSESRVLMESSPGYLAEASSVAPRLARALPRARLVFVLRDPVDRLLSSFRFYKSRLHVPDGMALEEFVNLCLQFEAGSKSADQLGLKEWHLRALLRGRYELALPEFESRFGPEQLLILGFDELQRDARGVMAKVCAHAALDDACYDDYPFVRENAGFHARARLVQAAALQINNRFERFWRSHPGLKRSLLSAYKRLNARRGAGPEPVAPQVRARLETYYAQTYTLLGARGMVHGTNR